jgi:hypothetical protein
MSPNFLVIGAAKSGSTWLHICLSEHPEIFLPKAKEIHYFSYENLFAQGVNWYEDFFKPVTTEKAIGEISNSYLPSETAAQRIYEYNPDLKLICILRNPIERAYSHYCMDLRTGIANQDMNIGLGPESPYVKWGLYNEQLKYYRDRFGDDRIKVLLFDDLSRQPEVLLREVYTHLQVDPEFDAPSTRTPKNTKKNLPRFPRLYRSLKSVYRDLMKVPVARDMLVPLRLNGYFDFFHTLNQGDGFPPLSRDRGKSLADYYHRDLDELSRFVGQDLSDWLLPYAQ